MEPETIRELDGLSDALAPLREHGWSIRFSKAKVEPDQIDITVEHQLSSAVTFSHVLGWEGILARLEALVSSDEAATIARAPEIMRHARLIAALRRSASAEEWSAEILSSVAATLWGCGLLTRDECAWLCEAGPLRSLSAPAIEPEDTREPTSPQGA